MTYLNLHGLNKSIRVNWRFPQKLYTIGAYRGIKLTGGIDELLCWN